MYRSRNNLYKFALVLVTIILVIWTIKRQFPDPLNSIVIPGFSKRLPVQEPIESNTIHLVHIIIGGPTFMRSVTMLKSLFYYQDRLASNRSECQMQRLPSPHPCNKRHGAQRQKIHLHLIAERPLWNQIKSSYRHWKTKQFIWTLYDPAAFQPRVNWIPNAHYAGPATLLKMLVPDILPTTVLKAIVLDTDVLLNADIVELWDLFEDFNEKQIFGLAWEPDETYPGCGGSPIPPKGVNSGVFLMHLYRMRRVQWVRIFEMLVREALFRYGSLLTGEQTTLEILIHKLPELYYQLPCEWNVQLWSNAVQKCCPVIWFDRLPNEPVCQNRTFPTQLRLPNLIHYDTGRAKPESGAATHLVTRTHLDFSKPQSRDQLMARFLKLYWSFKAIPQDCFS